MRNIIITSIFWILVFTICTVFADGSKTRNYTETQVLNYKTWKLTGVDSMHSYFDINRVVLFKSNDSRAIFDMTLIGDGKILPENYSELDQWLYDNDN